MSKTEPFIYRDCCCVEMCEPERWPEKVIWPNVLLWIVICFSFYFQIIVLPLCKNDSCYFNTLVSISVLCCVGSFCILSSILIILFNNRILFIIAILMYLITMFILVTIIYGS